MEYSRRSWLGRLCCLHCSLHLYSAPLHIQNGTTINFRIAATDNAGRREKSREYASTTIAIPTLIAEPPSVHFDGQLDDATNLLRISWDESTDSLFTRYEVQAKFSPLGALRTQRMSSCVSLNVLDQWSTVAIIFDRSMTTLSLRDLSPSAQYELRICSVNQFGLASYSDTINFTTPALPPNSKPISGIAFPRPEQNLRAANATSVVFQGYWSDSDGIVDRFNWASDIDGQIGDACVFSTPSLSVGKHTVNFTVRDSDGAWSDPATTRVAILASQINFVNVEEDTYGIHTIATSMIEPLRLDRETANLSFNVSEPKGFGDDECFCNITIPKALMGSDPLEAWIIRVDGQETDNRIITQNDTCAFLCFDFSAAVHSVTIQGTYVIPELSLWNMLATLAAMVIIFALGTALQRIKRALSESLHGQMLITVFLSLIFHG